MFSILASAAFSLLVFSQAEASEGYCYSNSKVCEAIVEVGYLKVVNNETIRDRPEGSVAALMTALHSMRKTYCHSEKATQLNECDKCWIEVMRKPESQMIEEMKKCVTGHPNPEYKRLTQFANDEKVDLVLDYEHADCYYNPMGVAVFGARMDTYTFDKAPVAGTDMTSYQKWFARTLSTLDYIDVKLAKGASAYKATCKNVIDSEIIKRFMSLEFFGLDAQQLKEEVMCACSSNM